MDSSVDNPPTNKLPQGLSENDVMEAVAASGYQLQTLVAQDLRRDFFHVQEDWSSIDKDSTGWSTHWGTCWRCVSRPPPSRTGRGWTSWRARCRNRPGKSVELAYADQGYTGNPPAAEASRHQAGGFKQPASKRGFVLLPRRWVVERSFFAWATRFRRLAKDYERLPETVAGLHFVAFACLMLHRAILPLGAGP